MITAVLLYRMYYAIRPALVWVPAKGGRPPVTVPLFVATRPVPIFLSMACVIMLVAITRYLISNLLRSLRGPAVCSPVEVGRGAVLICKPYPPRLMILRMQRLGSVMAGSTV